MPGQIVAARNAASRPDTVPQGTGVCDVRGRVTKLHGWLGQFLPEWSVDGEDRQSTAVTDGNQVFDIVIDLSRSPLIDRSVPPFGYFAPRDREQLTEALDQAAELIGRFAKPKYFHYDPGICAHESFGQTGCTRCLDVCGADAIRSEGDRIAVEPHLCQGCAACTLACPTGALSYARNTRESLLAALDDALGPAGASAPVLVAGQPATPLPETEGDRIVHFPVEPLAAFGEELWFAALARGAGRVVLLADGAMPSETLHVLGQRVDMAQRILRACGQPADAIALAADRDEASTLIRGNRVHPTPTDGVRDGTPEAPMTAENKRALLSAALQRLEPPQGFEPEPLAAGAPLGTVAIDGDRCTMCSACAKICPTGALRYADEGPDGNARLGFAEDLCVQCGACAQGCPEQAVSLLPRIAPDATRAHWRVLNKEPLATCPDCGQGFMPRKLLEANIHRMRGDATPDAAIDQMRRCPDCRHQRIRTS